MASQGSNVDLLIVGAGPAGLMAACCAAQYSMSTRIIDEKETRTQTGHGDGFQTRTLEILDSFGLAEDILKQSTPESESSYWMAEKKPGNIQRVKTEKSNSGQDSRFTKALLNQGATEQVLLDYLEQKQNVHVERSKQAKTLDFKDLSAKISFPVSVGIRRLTVDGSDASNQLEVINARYVVACDGAHSWTRDQLGVSTEGDSKGSTWGIFDIVPITDFRML
ncbi:uncharacterized protein LDX57_002906 [Aspergillus melleus]|uniref:uncharacterized protein n=1 Tax=Aspergillus melleus TaxID=138277 RepID=UPI001E8E19F6|nr:uncharacterized protein LDX57_002906 [Aspergillus melleus]KAH8425157.1 hypothetical protein LDX57_002906 [Aspergillus melleus]